MYRGLIYHRLNKKFLSPTINLWMDQKDFLKMVSDLKYYMSLDLCFNYSVCDYPVASIDGIKIHFNHYKSEDEALACWERRKNRISYDNLYVIMYDRDGISERDFDTLAKVNCKNKVILSSRRYNNYDFIKTLQPNVGATHGELYLDTDSIGMREFEKQWDFVEWLNCK